METYCIKCRKKTENLKPKIFKAIVFKTIDFLRNSRLIMQSKWDECRNKKIYERESTRSKWVTEYFRN